MLDIHRKYLLDHASRSHKIVASWLDQANCDYEAFVEFEEFLFDFVLSEYKIVISIIEEAHDHTDSYYTEHKMQQACLEKSFSLLFIDEFELRQNLDQAKTSLMNTLNHH